MSPLVAANQAELPTMIDSGRRVKKVNEEARFIIPVQGRDQDAPREYVVTPSAQVFRHSDGFVPRQRVDETGNLHVTLTSREGYKQLHRRVAYLVGQAFIVGPRVKIHRLRFKDGDPLNCHADNLEILTYRVWE